MATLEFLPWDSNCFGYGVVRLDASDEEQEVLSLLNSARDSLVKLVYWEIDVADSSAQQLAEKLGGISYAEKVVYTCTIPLASVGAPQIRSATEKDDDEPLLNLFLQSGEFSRFNLDPRFTDEFGKLYTAWYRNSLARLNAWDVLVWEEGDRIQGVVTIGDTNGYADVGILAVAEGERGKGIGGNLLQAAFDKSRLRGYDKSRVVTQLQNIPACSLYEKNGYTVRSAQRVYHLWI